MSVSDFRFTWGLRTDGINLVNQWRMQKEQDGFGDTSQFVSTRNQLNAINPLSKDYVFGRWCTEWAKYGEMFWKSLWAHHIYCDVIPTFCNSHSITTLKLSRNHLSFCGQNCSRNPNSLQSKNSHFLNPIIVSHIVNRKNKLITMAQTIPYRNKPIEHVCGRRTDAWASLAWIARP